MNQPATAPAPFVGWHRPGPRSPWRKIVEADTESAAFNRLLDTVRGGDKIVLPVGLDPNETPWPR